MCVIATDGSILCSIVVPVIHNLTGTTIAIPCEELAKIEMLKNPLLSIAISGTGHTVSVPGVMTLPLKIINQDRVPNVEQILSLTRVDVKVDALYGLDYLRKIIEFCDEVNLPNVCHSSAGVDKPVCFSDPATPPMWKIYLMPVEYRK